MAPQTKSKSKVERESLRHRYDIEEGQYWRDSLRSDFQKLGVDLRGSLKRPRTDLVADPQTRKYIPYVSQDSAFEPRHGSAYKTSSRRNTCASNDGKESSQDLKLKRRRTDPDLLVPIMIVPYASALISLLNTAEFFENGRFVTHGGFRNGKNSSVLPIRLEVARTPRG